MFDKDKYLEHLKRERKNLSEIQAETPYTFRYEELHKAIDYCLNSIVKEIENLEKP